jgi:hypothetical protein
MDVLARYPGLAAPLRLCRYTWRGTQRGDSHIPHLAEYGVMPVLALSLPSLCDVTHLTRYARDSRRNRQIDNKRDASTQNASTCAPETLLATKNHHDSRWTTGGQTERFRV